MNITISGATGFIGTRLVQSLAEAGHELRVLSRRAGRPNAENIPVFAWDAEHEEAPADALRGADAVIHLAGEPVAQRWNDAAKRRIRESRVAGTRNLVEALGRLRRPPSVLVCSSATGYYGSRGDEILTECSAAGTGYLAEVCQAWEEEARQAEILGVRVVRLRTGVALDRRGGALQRMLPAFRMAVGGRLGDGEQWMSWIHRDDLVGLIRFALDRPVSGAINGVAPEPVTNRDFTAALAHALHRPAIFPAPAAALRALFGEMAGMLLASQRVLPEAAQNAGYEFRFRQLDRALADILK